LKENILLGAKLTAALAKRGAVYLFHRYKFKDVEKAKYCVLFEDYREGAESVIVAFTTSRLESLAYPTVVEIPNGTIDDITGASALQCDNHHEIEASKLFSTNVKYLGQLPENILEEIDEAIEYVEAPEHIIIRMFGLTD
jgi:mRNA-degrading endonuclease toxin of MazEF toxin-antitoxin module